LLYSLLGWIPLVTIVTIEELEFIVRPIQRRGKSQSFLVDFDGTGVGHKPFLCFPISEMLERDFHGVSKNPGKADEVSAKLEFTPGRISKFRRICMDFLRAKRVRFPICTGDFFDTEGVDPVT
jgi:hypothetical protein